MQNTPRTYWCISKTPGQHLSLATLGITVMISLKFLYFGFWDSKMDPQLVIIIPSSNSIRIFGKSCSAVGEEK